MKHHLEALKLPTILAECEKVAGRCAAENIDHLSFLLLRPITITGGHEVHPGERVDWKEPKKCLASTTQVLLQGRRLTVAKSLAFAPILVEELLNFQVKITDSANETWQVARGADVGTSHSTDETGERVVCSDPGEGRGRRVTELLGGNMASALELDPVSTKLQQIAQRESVA